MLDEKDVREEVNHVLSEAYEGKDWMEDGSIRQDITDLKSNILDLDDDIDKLDDKIKGIDNTQKEVNTLMNDVDGLRVTIQELVTVTNKHDVKLLSLSDKIDSAVVCIQTLNKMVEMISKRVGLKDESE